MKNKALHYLLGLCLVLGALGMPLTSTTQAAVFDLNLPPGFVRDRVIYGPNAFGGGEVPTSMAWAPDGRLFIGLKSGRIRIWLEMEALMAVSIAAFNGPKSLTLSGLRTSLEPIAAELEAQGIFARFLQVSHPFHHAMMQPAADALNAALLDLTPTAETLPFFSTVTGGRLAGTACVADHWSSGVRQPVEFAQAIGAVAEFGVDVWLEIGAHPALVRSIQECLGENAAKATILASARREREHESLLETAMDLHLAGVVLDFTAITPSRQFLDLPAYAWDKSRWWNESAEMREGRLSPGGRGLLDVRLPRANPTWITRLDNRHMAFLKDHRVENMIIFPAAGFVEMVLEAGIQLFEGKPFVVEDFEIRKPLILPDPPSGLLLELSYEPGERTFSIQSRFESGASWSVHVVGSMRANARNPRSRRPLGKILRSSRRWNSTPFTAT